MIARSEVTLTIRTCLRRSLSHSASIASLWRCTPIPIPCYAKWPCVESIRHFAFHTTKAIPNVSTKADVDGCARGANAEKYPPFSAAGAPMAVTYFRNGFADVAGAKAFTRNAFKNPREASPICASTANAAADKPRLRCVFDSHEFKPSQDALWSTCVET